MLPGSWAYQSALPTGRENACACRGELASPYYPARPRRPTARAVGRACDPSIQAGRSAAGPQRPGQAALVPLGREVRWCGLSTKMPPTHTPRGAHFVIVVCTGRLGQPGELGPGRKRQAACTPAPRRSIGWSAQRPGNSLRRVQLRAVDRLPVPHAALRAHPHVAGFSTNEDSYVQGSRNRPRPDQFRDRRMAGRGGRGHHNGEPFVGRLARRQAIPNPEGTVCRLRHRPRRARQRPLQRPRQGVRTGGDHHTGLRKLADAAGNA